ncbi:PHA/PHB synthase family protein [Massilia sp. DWR3-1-1]|uniref:PHA/PHB synthase family protein n=1 Tax=Massilia sp. DWR3-1-1 TaxID=2804559 RepID=UPI003CE74225
MRSADPRDQQLRLVPTPVPVPAAGAERQGSAWQGSWRVHPETRMRHDGVDLAFNAALARLTGFVSPMALQLAWHDWAGHLLLSPDKQRDLLEQAGASLWRWTSYAWQAALGGAAAPLAPLAQDRRFDSPAWQYWPYNVISQGFLLQQQWWHRATSDVRGVAPHHADVVTFVARQLLDWAAPSNFVWTNPEVGQATLASAGANLAAGAARAAGDGWRELLRQPHPLPLRPGRELAVTPGKVVLRNHLIELLRYDSATPQVHERPLLIIPAWIMKFYILDLAPRQSLVAYLVEQGHCVYMISWRNPAAAERDLSLDDYRRLGIMEALNAIGRLHPGVPVNACGYCLGGTLLAIAAAAMASARDRRLASVTLLAAQVDFTDPGELSLFIDESQVSFLEAAMWRDGYLDTRQMAGAFQLLRSNDLIWSYRLRHYLLGLPERVDALSAWNADTTRMPCRMHSDYLRHLFLRNELATGRYVVDGRALALADIHLPIFAVGTVTDHVAPWRSVHKISLLADTEVSFLLTSGGHNAGIVAPPGSAGRSYQMRVQASDAPYVDPDRWLADTATHEGSWWPAWAAWLATHAGPMVEASAPAGLASLGDAPGEYVLQR